MNFTDDTKFFSAFGEDCTASRMEGWVIAACGNIIVFNAQNVQQVFYNTFECEEIFILAVHT